MNGSWALLGLALVLSIVQGFGAKAMYVPVFALRRHHNTMKSSLGPFTKTGIDAHGVDYFPHLPRAISHGMRPVPGYVSGIFDEIEDYNDEGNLQVFTMSPPLAALGAQEDKYPSLAFKPPLHSGPKISSKSMFSRIEHPLPSNRFRMNPQCLVDPPKGSRLVARLKRQNSGAFYSFNPAGQQCEKLFIPNANIVPVGDNIYHDLESCQADCCPTALCVESLCSDHKDCASCAGASMVLYHCQWCVGSSTCHGNIENACESAELIDTSFDCPLTPDNQYQYSDDFARKTVLPFIGASNGENLDQVQTCLDTHFTNVQAHKQYNVVCDKDNNTCSAFLSVDTKNKAIILTFAGTNGISQLLDEGIDFLLDTLVPLPEVGGKVDKYYHTAYFILWNSAGIFNDLKALTAQYPGYEFWLNPSDPPFHHRFEVWYPNNMSPGDPYQICDRADDKSCSNAVKDDSTDDHLHYFTYNLPDCQAVIKWYRRQSSDSDTPIPYVCGLVGSLLWLRYAICIEDLKLILLQSYAVAMQTFFIITMIYYRSRRKKLLRISVVVVVFVTGLFVYVNALPHEEGKILIGRCASGAQIAGSLVCPYLIYRAISTRVIDFVPLAPVAFTFCMEIHAIIYSLGIDDFYMLLANTVFCCMDGSLLLMFAIFPHEKPRVGKELTEGKQFVLDQKAVTKQQ
ncbi:hypothetical protein FO519_001730 [Halicephalobus sp. NKZ332]|nr:hypothetical protein FO519_001730 [Halicephalobus sp. NKZ332]